MTYQSVGRAGENLASDIAESMRQGIFGAEPSGPVAETVLETALAELRRLTSHVLGPLSSPETGVPAELGAAVASRCATAVQELDSIATASGADALLRVVMMGRTMAGKSTLLETLTRGDGSRIGDGRQRFSRDVCDRAVPGVEGVVLVDTPGVGALDGAADVQLAFDTAREADLVLWIAADDSTQEDTAVRLRVLAALGKPVLVVLNCRTGLDLAARRADFLDEPQLAYAQAPEHLAIIDRHLAAVGVRAVGRIAIHADAAWRAERGDDDADRLRAASRIDDVKALLAQEHRALARHRRVVRRVDEPRAVVGVVADDLRSAAVALDAQVVHDRGRVADVCTRWGRVIEAAGEDLAASLPRVIDIRRSWHLSIDPNDDLEKEWKQESDRLEQEINDELTRVASELASSSERISRDVSSEWAHAALNVDQIEGIRGFGTVWANRIARGGLAVGMAWAVGAIGTAVAPGVGTVAGALVGAAIGTALSSVATPVKRFIDELFHGKDAVLRKRREQVEKKLQPILDQVLENASNAGDALIESYRSAVAAFKADQASAAEWQEKVAAGWAGRAEDLVAEQRRLDLRTSEVLLRLCGRHRAADAVMDSVRRPGVGTCVRLPEPAFSEMALFPVTTAERLVPAPCDDGQLPAGPALNVLVALGLQRDRLVRLDRDGIEVELTDVPLGVCAAWSELLTDLTRSSVQLRPAAATEAGTISDASGASDE